MVEKIIQMQKILNTNDNNDNNNKILKNIKKIKKPEISDKDIKGSKCSIKGKEYEFVVYNITTQLINIKTNLCFNTQNKNQLGGCSSNNDLTCNFNKEYDVGIEIKKMNTPDWMQCSLKYDLEKKIWTPTINNKIPDDSKKIFEKLLNSSEISVFNGKIPPFFSKKITHEEWLKIKSDSKDYNDHYLKCPDDTIAKLYSAKGCQYIQISNKGLYHLGNDYCDFNVPYFICPQKLRIRTKIHTRKDSCGFCKLSVTLSCMPQNIKELKNSEFSLDNFNKIPKTLYHFQ